MDNKDVQFYLMTNQKYFPEEKMMYLRNKLETADESRRALISTISLQDPTTFLLISIFLGLFGIDRFMLNDTGMGLLKLLTMSCCGILMIIDWFVITKKVKELNFIKVMSFL